MGLPTVNGSEGILIKSRFAQIREDGFHHTIDAYGILLKLSIGMDSVVWVRFGMGTLTVDGSWTSLECAITVCWGRVGKSHLGWEQGRRYTSSVDVERQDRV
ncbi:hypothetical protein F2Q70_00039789 [Brassica cretica]|uniref:Uncharacterized protein n=1 Tax=Brassica cretica TaxID=69181 RepID=A0A8S9KBU5_BRACR|nr:hypothetical protein F2Q70_00039789 [Brassica cretica]